MHSSNALPTCRIDWRPSRGVAVATGLLGLLALWSLGLSALSIPASSALAVAVVIHSVFLMGRELRREPFTFVWAGGDADATLNFTARTQSLSGPKLFLRGPLASLRGKDETGRSRIYLWWPDTLSSAARRQLRLVDQIRKEPQTSPPANSAA